MTVIHMINLYWLKLTHTESSVLNGQIFLVEFAQLQQIVGDEIAALHPLHLSLNHHPVNVAASLIERDACYLQILLGFFPYVL